MNKNYRIHTNISSDSLLQVNMRQDFDLMEVLSLTLSQKDAYKIHSSNYGVIVGRVLANDAFGIPNAKVSVFIEKDDTDTTELENIYPYSEITDKDKEGRRYNLLPDYSDDECYRIVGTFPNKRLLLDDTTYLEVYDKYWKYSTVTNNAGDFMIFAVPVGNQQIHVDIDMSDIGVLSQKPRDYMYKGYTETLFDSSTQFKSSTNLDNLTQIISQNKSVYVYPFWGDANNGIAAITRSDIQVNYKFEPTCVFIGSIISDNDGNNIDHKCGATLKSGFNNQLVAGEGTIEMIRKTQDGLVEEYPIQGNRLIDSDGVWCYQIPMNLDFVGTDEYGNIVPTDNPSKGIPTRTQVRFRISKTETGGEGFSRHTAKYLVPMNPILDETEVIPKTREESGQDMEKMYIFGSNTPQSCFRDLYWNNVYSVKNFIPKTQVARRAYSPYYNALKACNAVDNQNPIPFNKLMINIPFTYMFICLLFTIVVAIISFINNLINLLNEIIKTINSLLTVKIFGKKIFSFGEIGYIGCISMQAGSNAENKVYYPGCNQRGMDAADCPEDMDNCKKVNDKEELMDVIQQNLSQEYDVVRLDLFQDWLNGCLYMPLWFWKKAKKKKFLFITIRKAKNEYCSCDKQYGRLKTRYTCNIEYTTDYGQGNFDSMSVTTESLDPREDKWHKRREKGIYFSNGLIKAVENNDGLKAYYYTAFQPSSNDKIHIDDIKQRKTSFEFVRLFATDIILLGNLNENNIYGIPQLFNNIPSTTSNVPPIATIEESSEAVDEGKDNVGNELSLAQTEDDGSVITTGMDWGYAGNDDSPIYRKGLFLDLACLYADTRAKACINVERLSELGVGLDMSYKMEYAKGSDIVEGVINSDGFVNKFEITDNDSRAMFATLNHVGFVPQDYQTDKNMYETQVMDNRTGYLVNKFKYTYPVDFDGRMQPIMDDYENGFAQPLYDTRDESYLTFRLGAEGRKEESDVSKHGRIRHFYYNNKSKGTLEMPLYNNSFYFYFGINKGNTAIDKFYSKFIAPCSKNEVKPFTMDITTQGAVECSCMYKIKDYRSPFIKAVMDDIQTPYSFELRDSNNNFVVSGDNKTETELIIPDLTDKNTSALTLSNQTYTLRITDANNRKQSERIVVETPKISIDYETQKLGTKFYNIETTRADYICNDETMFYGILRVKSFTIDGYPFDITEVKPIGYDDTTNSYVVMLTGTNDLQEQKRDENGKPVYDTATNEPVMENVFYNGDTVSQAEDIQCACEKTKEGEDLNKNLNQVIIYLSTVENKTSEAGSTSAGAATTNGVRNCLCDKKNPVAITQGSANNMNIATADAINSPMWLGTKFCIPKIDESVYYNSTEKANEAINDYNQGKAEKDQLSANDIYKIAEFYVFQPNTFLLTASQMCHKQIVSSNTISETAVIQNGENFNAYLNKMPVRFMIGTINDSSDGAIGNTSCFYRTEITEDPSSEGFNGWFGVHQEDTYRFSPTIEKNKVIWDDYVVLKSGISTSDAKKKILKYKFETMFSVAEATYVTNDSSIRYTYRAEGGVGVPLNRTVAPVYDGAALRKESAMYSLTDRSTVTGIRAFPNIVATNYKGYSDKEDKPYLNVNFKPYPEHEGNYFAVFSNNGGYSSNTAIDETLPVIKSPNFTKITPKQDDTVKQIGKDIKGDINNFLPAYDKYSSYLPYLRTMFVDRRLDFNLEILAPSTGSNIRLYPLVDGKPSPKEKVWKGGRISGTTYGGIEMSYDDDYNILSADTNDEFTEAVKNNKLEYTINYSSTPGEDAKTYFNEKPEVPRRLYEAELNGVDIRDMFWSEGRKETLTALVSSPENKLEKGNIYYYKYPSRTTGLYNGDFYRKSVIISDRNRVSNYPTKRYIDVGNLPMVGGSSSLLLSSCNYNVKPTLDSVTGELQLKTSKGESLEYEFSFQKPITMVQPSSENDTFGNVNYKYVTSMNVGGDLYYNLMADTATLMFKLNSFKCDGFNVYTQGPKILRVLPYIDGIDGISFYKTITNNGNEDGPYAGSGTINDTLYHRNYGIIVDYFHRVGERNNNFGLLFLSTNDTLTSEPIEYNGDYENNFGEHVPGFFLKYRDSDEYVESNALELNNVIFSKTIALNSDTRVFTIVIEREFESTSNDNLKKHISTVETSDLYDARPLLLSIDKDNTYIEMIPVGVDSTTSTESSTNVLADTAVTAKTETTGITEGDVDVPTYEEGEDGGIVPGEGDSSHFTAETQVTASTSTTSRTDTEADTTSISTTESSGQSHVQTMGFKFRFDLAAAPADAQCEAFADYKNMSYTFIFKNANGDSYSLYPYDINPIEAESNDSTLVLGMKVKWSQGMGIMPDNEWYTNTNITILGKTKENFVYKIPDMKFKFNSFADSGINYDPGRKSSNMEKDKHYKINIALTSPIRQ